jgi:hypothetical protein
MGGESKRTTKIFHSVLLEDCYWKLRLRVPIEFRAPFYTPPLIEARLSSLLIAGEAVGALIGNLRSEVVVHAIVTEIDPIRFKWFVITESECNLAGAFSVRTYGLEQGL